MIDKGRMTAYINPQSSQQFRDAAGYTLADGSPALDVVCIFAGNYAAAEQPYLRANNNNPATTQPFNDNIQQVLDDGSVKYLQSKGLAVLLTVTNGWQSVGWSEFTSEGDAMSFAQYLKTEVVEKYGLDGIDIDDEYSTGSPNNTSLIMVTTLMRQIMPDKIISKALWSDYGYFQATWNGNTLAGNLNYGAEMSYGGDPQSRLEPYTQVGLNKGQLSLGFTADRPSSDPDQDVQWLKANGYAGVMAYAFEEQANIDLMGRLVNDWYGPGNWNPPAE
ncbi:MAG: hypothetical protein ACJ74T_00460 [Pyrinomonadaceae bacterium]